ncbi:MAG: peptidylprolyl isomerase [Anaerolineae bacterium]|nr:peptidylprolyl isomerase [Anaerolineae bacterium]
MVYRHFPLDSHANARAAAAASEAAATQDAFWPYHDLLFERQREWSGLAASAAQDYFVELAVELGLDSDQFSAEMNDGIHDDYIQNSYQEAVNLQLPGTPSAIVDGFPVGSIPSQDIWENYIDQQIALADLEARQYDAAPPMSIDVDASYQAIVEMENGATFTIELLPSSAPQTVNSFVFLAEAGWFDDVMFHRVIPGFVAQTGDPSATGRGGPGYMLPNEIDLELSHDTAGMVAMANSGPDTSGSQWYITLADGDQSLMSLDGGYTIFGRIVDGLDVVQAIAPRDPDNPNAGDGDRIKSITIVSE